jgi:hypothetical protein
MKRSGLVQLEIGGTGQANTNLPTLEGKILAFPLNFPILRRCHLAFVPRQMRSPHREMSAR